MVGGMKKKTKFELRRELKRERNKFLTATRLACCNCMGFFVDGYSDCGITRCPLYPFKVKKGNLQAEKFKALVKQLKRFYDNDQYLPSDFWSKIYKEL